SSNAQNQSARPQTNRPNPNASDGQRSARPQANRARGGGSARRGTSRPAPPPRSSAQPRAAPNQTNPDNSADATPAARRYLIDFGVIRNTEASPITVDAEVSFLQGQRGGITDADTIDVTLRPIKTSRARSVPGFQVVRCTYLSPGRFRVSVKFSPQSVRRGVHVVRLCLDAVSGNHTDTRWHKLRAIIGAPEDHEELKPIAPFTRRKEPDHNDWHRRRMLRGKPPVSTPDFMKLGFYDVPEDFRRNFNIENNRPGRAALLIHLRSLLPTSLNINTYKHYWTTLLWHEELQMEIDLKLYDMEGVPVRHVSSLDYALTVPGLLEKRPSVIVTDLVAMKEPGIARRGPVHGGFVTEVQQSDLILRMHESFPSISNQLWDVRFTVNRLLLRRMHDSINKASPHERILFPTLAHRKPPAASLRTNPRLDRKVASNFQQSLAVRQILAQPPGDVPFIIFGPPGTGKTTALVEAIHQIVLSNPKHRVLVCAPSNTATDLITTRLSKMHSPSELLRLNAPARFYDTLPVDLRRYSVIDDGKKFKSPPKNELEKFRMVLSTCYYASIPQALGIKNHFTHIFVDEAGHATEPEVMVAVLQNAGPETNVIMCGDPMQLGPIVQSKECGKLGMNASFLDRLTKMPVYQTENQEESNPKIVKLLQNYRSHPAILRFSNIAFYKNELEPHADSIITRSLEYFSELPKDGFPIIFHSICGHNMQEAKSPSFFNVDEATLVRHYVHELLSNRRLGLITLTRAQALLIVIGNAATLELDPAWYFFLHYVHASGGWRGDESGYAPTLTSNIFKGVPDRTKNYEDFDDARWDALMDAAAAFEL
ncbi:hypothetical protein FRC07_003275, partial [Ceratobasidium sp. 392]